MTRSFVCTSLTGNRRVHGVEQDGPVLRISGLRDRGFVVYRSLGGLEGADLDELIARQVQVFGERGERFEWKLHGHDRPADLPQRLRTAGFVHEEGHDRGDEQDCRPAATSRRRDVAQCDRPARS
jgi:hypothetical protein